MKGPIVAALGVLLAGPPVLMPLSAQSVALTFTASAPEFEEAAAEYGPAHPAWPDQTPHTIVSPWEDGSISYVPPRHRGAGRASRASTTAVA